MDLRSPRVDLALALLIVGMWVCISVFRHWGEWNVDMSAIYMAARFIFLGEFGQIYAAPEGFFGTDIPDRWLDELNTLGFENEVAVPYVYPPLWAYLLSPFAGRVDPIVFFDITRLVLTACFGGAILAAWKLMRPQYLSMAIFSAISVAIAEATIPAQFALMLNQPQIFVVLLVILAFERYLARCFVTAGILLGVAAAIKITPIMLCLLFLLDRNWRAASTCMITAAFLAMISLLTFGLEPHLSFLGLLSQIDSLVPMIGLNTNLEIFLHQLAVPIEARLQDFGSSVAGKNILWITLVNNAALVLALAISVTSTAKLPAEDRIRVRLFLFAIVFVVFGPLAWAHYYVLPLLLLPGLWGIFTLGQTGALVSLMVAIFSLPMTLISLLAVKNYGTFPMVCLPVILLVIVLTLKFSRYSATKQRAMGSKQTTNSALA